MSTAPHATGTLSLLCVFCSWIAVARADTPEPGVGSMLRAAGDCAHLFGTLHSRMANKELREGKIHWVEEEKTGITVAHSHRTWGHPIRLLPRGVSLNAVKEIDKETSKVVIQLHQGLAARLGCPAGEYLLQMDDSIGGQMQILAVLKHYLLVRYNQQLGYLSLPVVKRPNWLMAWRPHGTIQTARGPASAKNVIKPSPSPKVRKVPDRPKRAPRPVDIKR